jgi:predicted ATPase with chaperone activity
VGHRQRATSSLNSGFDYPSKAVTIDLAPANMRNEGAHHSDEPDLGRGADAALREAVARAERGQIDADLGAEVILRRQEANEQEV